MEYENKVLDEMKGRGISNPVGYPTEVQWLIATGDKECRSYVTPPPASNRNYLSRGCLSYLWF